MPKNDPILDALASAAPSRGGTQPRLLMLWGDRPDVLEEVRKARKRRVSYTKIASLLSAAGEPIGEGAVKKWLESEGIT